ncbi:MAG: exodeoxyribonuclease VII small subunit [Oscillospiraceae bacterium]|nr:exodeoxyribonuclease VII small subunit [Oscillospiraceae bacterium]
MEQLELTFEQALERVEEIVKQLERGDAPLDKALALFEESAKLIQSCNKMLDDAEQTIVRLQRNQDGEMEEVAFDDED